MTKYEELMNKSDECCRKAIQYTKKQDWYMSKFYRNASYGFKIRAGNLKIRNADETEEK